MKKKYIFHPSIVLELLIYPLYFNFHKFSHLIVKRVVNSVPLKCQAPLLIYKLNLTSQLVERFNL